MLIQAIYYSLVISYFSFLILMIINPSFNKICGLQYVNTRLYYLYDAQQGVQE